MKLSIFKEKYKYFLGFNIFFTYFIKLLVSWSECLNKTNNMKHFWFLFITKKLKSQLSVS